MDNIDIGQRFNKDSHSVQKTNDKFHWFAFVITFANKSWDYSISSVYFLKLFMLKNGYNGY